MKLVPNYENREFTDRKPLEVLVTDLTFMSDLGYVGPISALASISITKKS